MHFDNFQTDDLVLAELGRRLELKRLSRNLTQTELAELAGVGRATVQRLEAGKTVQLSSIIKILRGLGTLEELDAAIAEPPLSPIAELERAGRQPHRRRASGLRKHDSEPAGREIWTWGEGEQSGADS